MRSPLTDFSYSIDFFSYQNRCRKCSECVQTFAVAAGCTVGLIVGGDTMPGSCLEMAEARDVNMCLAAVARTAQLSLLLHSVSIQSVGIVVQYAHSTCAKHQPDPQEPAHGLISDAPAHRAGR